MAGVVVVVVVGARGARGAGGRLIFRRAIFEAFPGAVNSGVSDGSVLVAVGPVNVMGFPLENVRRMLTQADVRRLLSFSSDVVCGFTSHIVVCGCLRVRACVRACVRCVCV
jgi:hypothetical protein